MDAASGGASYSNGIYGSQPVDPSDMESYPLLPPHRLQYLPSSLLVQAQADIAALCNFGDADDQARRDGSATADKSSEVRRKPVKWTL
jgi:hypothetical protein